MFYFHKCFTFLYVWLSFVCAFPMAFQCKDWRWSTAVNLTLRKIVGRTWKSCTHLELMLDASVSGLLRKIVVAVSITEKWRNEEENNQPIIYADWRIELTLNAANLVDIVLQGQFHFNIRTTCSIFNCWWRLDHLRYSNDPNAETIIPNRRQQWWNDSRRRGKLQLPKRRKERKLAWLVWER